MQRPAKAKLDPQAALEARVFVSLMRAADVLARGAEALLKPYSISGTQYNLLRILRGAGEKGLACCEVGSRLISRDPDITRLLDRMEKRGLITRERQTEDRRVIMTRITQEGLACLKKLDNPISELHQRQLGHMKTARKKILAELLEEVNQRELTP
jgi:DNA-binding MarR family transcriptional regulator